MNKKLFALLVAVFMVVAFVIPISALTPVNLVENGDFEAGNIGFDTDYTYLDPANTGPWTLGPEFMYTIGTNPGLYHSAWLPGFGDHTTGTSNMMIVNGTPSDTDPKALVWGQTVALPAVPADAFSEVDEFVLYAGQNWEIGRVLVKNTLSSVCVKFIIDDPDAIVDGWLITEAHVAIGETLADIPQKNGNPIPGKFPINLSFTPGLVETDWLCLPFDFEIGDDLIIAAHAKIEHAEVGHTEYYNFCMLSGPETELADGTFADISAVDPWGNLDINVSSGFVDPTLANYMWDADVATGYYADNGGMVDFVQHFNVIGNPTSATLKIAADNAFAYKLNGGAEIYENLTADWRDYAALSDFGYPYMVIDPLTTGWSQVYTYDVLSSLVTGSNLFEVTGVNADWNTTSWSVNPAAVIYKLCGTSELYVIDEPYDDETGWGGEGKFTGKNWAKYISYKTQTPVVTYRLTMYGASSYQDNPAQLEVSLNGQVAGVATLTSTRGEWVKVEYDWNVGLATEVVIAIRDLRPTYHGDDFCIDDISLVMIP